MSGVVVVPDLVASAASDLQNVGSTLNAANAAAAVPTTGVVAAAGDEVSAAVASLFSGHGQAYQALSAQLEAFHQDFVQALSSSGGSYLAAEAANASPLQTVEQDILDVVNFPTNALLGRPLIGNGANGGPGQAGAPGGFLIGNGGAGGNGNADGMAGGAGGAAGLIGQGGPGGAGGAYAAGGTGGHGGILYGNGGTGGPGGNGLSASTALASDGGGGGAGGAAGFIGSGGKGGNGGTAGTPAVPSTIGGFGGGGGLGGNGGWLFGQTGATGQAGGTIGGIVPLTLNNTVPLVDISVNGGPTVPVEVDTGSEGLVIPLKDVSLWHLGLPTGAGVGAYSSGLEYLYVSFDAPVNFGNGVVTAPTPVDVVVFSFPQSFSSFFSGNGASGILGIGPNASGPGPSSVTTALPGTMNQGVLINEQDGYLQFGSNPLTNPASSLYSPTAYTLQGGVPLNTLEVSINNGTPVPVSSIIDSGGVTGTMPSNVAGSLPDGTKITVYNSTGTNQLYTYTVTGNAPTIDSSGGTYNTGYEPFALQNVYVSNNPGGEGSITFGDPSQ